MILYVRVLIVILYAVQYDTVYDHTAYCTVLYVQYGKKYLGKISQRSPGPESPRFKFASLDSAAPKTALHGRLLRTFRSKPFWQFIPDLSLVVTVSSLDGRPSPFASAIM